MFFEQIKASFIAQNNQFAAQVNQESERRFIQSAQDWARNGGKDGEPKPDNVVEAQFNFDEGLSAKLVATDRPVSTIDPKTFLPTYGTDTDAVGGEVGGPIPGKSKRFYVKSNATPWIGKLARVGGRTFVCNADTPFTRFWEEV